MVGFSPSSRAPAVLTAFVLGALAAVACGGQSLVHTDGDAGASGDAGTGQSGYSGTSYDGGTSGVGGSSTGGLAGTIDLGGTTSVGGSSIGGSSIGGSSIGGSSIGGSSFGGVAGTSGSAGFAGAGDICSLPIQAGSCQAYVPSFAFSVADGDCQPFIYGGCGGNANRFSTLAECEAKCGGSLSACPPSAPYGQACMTEGQLCTYDWQNCLCSPKVPLQCSKVDDTCPQASDGGVSGIVIVVMNSCTCLNGAWNCQPVTTGGGPP